MTVTTVADELAGVIVEPFQRIVPPLPGFLEGLRELTTQYNIPLIFDEIVTVRRPFALYKTADASILALPIERYARDHHVLIANLTCIACRASVLQWVERKRSTGYNPTSVYLARFQAVGCLWQ